MNLARIFVSIKEEEMWRRIKGYRKHLERIVSTGLEPRDELPVRELLCRYLLARMTLEDYDVSEFMNAERLQAQHAEEQTWQCIRGFREDLERIADTGLKPDDEPIIKALCNYLIARMDIADYDLEEE